MSRSTVRRGQVEPLAALAAVLVLGVALGLYADVLAAVQPTPAPSGAREATLQRAADVVTEDGAAEPDRLSRP